MSDAEILEKLRLLPREKRDEIFDFVDYLVGRFGKASDSSWTEPAFSEFAFAQALRGMEDDPVAYDRSDIRQAWR